MSDIEAKSLDSKEVSRRQFLKVAGTAVASLVLAETIPNLFWVDEGLAAIPVSGGYLLIDTKKCAGCASCMLACSLAHEGQENLSLSRIQIVQNPFERFPYDVNPSQCRQCVDAKCVEVCPTGALRADPDHGNVRTVDEKACIGCQQCVRACPFTPSRAVFDFEGQHSQKCDLCSDTPFWSEHGGPGGRQACVDVCPMKAIRFTAELPSQVGDSGYRPNLRGAGWKNAGLPAD